MNNTKTKIFTAKIITVLAAIAASVVLPQIFHYAGIISGTDAALGTMFLPMHIPVLIAGFLAGPVVGVTAGILSPLISFAVSGMPTVAVLPFMVIELAVYGLVSGIFSKAKMPSFAKLVITQLAGRAARALAILAAIFLLGNEQLTVASIGVFIVSGVFGILLQWAVVPLLLYRLEGVKKLY